MQWHGDSHLATEQEEGNTILDWSGIDRNGTLDGCTRVVGPFDNGSLHFDGVSSEVVMDSALTELSFPFSFNKPLNRHTCVRISTAFSLR